MNGVCVFFDCLKFEGRTWDHVRATGRHAHHFVDFLLWYVSMIGNFDSEHRQNRRCLSTCFYVCIYPLWRMDTRVWTVGAGPTLEDARLCNGV